MKKQFTVEEMDLQLFAEGAGGADGGASGSAAAGVTAGDAGQQNTGVEGGAAQQAASADAGQNEDSGITFEELIKGKYKEEYNANVKKIVDGRVGSLNKQLQGYQAGQAVFEILAQKYGLEPTDYAGIAKAAENDKSFVEQEAMETGKDPQDLLELKKVQRENATLRRQQELDRQQKADQQRMQQISAQEALWEQQAREAQKVYPGLKLDTEIKNPDFARLLRSGVPVQAAYQVVHMNEIMGGAMQYAAQRAAKNVTDNVIAGAARPAENGTGAQGAASVKVDPSKFTSKELQEYRERVARGERITFA